MISQIFKRIIENLIVSACVVLILLGASKAYATFGPEDGVPLYTQLFNKLIYGGGEPMKTVQEILDGGDISLGQWTESGGNIVRMSGKVGIGTINPTDHLTVMQSMQVLSPDGAPHKRSQITMGGVGGDPWHWAIGTDITINNSDTFYIGTEITTPLAIKGDGRIGIGHTDPTAKLEIRHPAVNNPSVSDSNIYVRGSDQGFGLGIGTRMNSPGGVWLQNMVNDVPGVANILLNPLGGNVGIGTSTPGEKLVVEGNVAVAGTITAGRFALQNTVTTSTVYGGANTQAYTACPAGYILSGCGWFFAAWGGSTWIDGPWMDGNGCRIQINGGSHISVQAICLK